MKQPRSGLLVMAVLLDSTEPIPVQLEMEKGVSQLR